MKLEPFIPRECFRSESVEQFIERCEELDEYFSLLFGKLKSDQTMRYVASFKHGDSGAPSIAVGFQVVPKASNLGRLTGTTNFFYITTDIYPANAPFIIEAPGAGLDVTARNILDDITHPMDRTVVFAQHQH